MLISEFKNSKYLRKEDIDDAVLATIKDVTSENVAREGDPPEKRAVMYFRELDKPMVCNMTNLSIAAMAFDSEDTDDWIGKKIVVYVDPSISFGGRVVGGLRLRAPRKQAQAKPVQRQIEREDAGGVEDMDSDIPF